MNKQFISNLYITKYVQNFCKSSDIAHLPPLCRHASLLKDGSCSFTHHVESRKNIIRQRLMHNRNELNQYCRKDGGWRTTPIMMQAHAWRRLGVVNLHLPLSGATTPVSHQNSTQSCYDLKLRAVYFFYNLIIHHKWWYRQTDIDVAIVLCVNSSACTLDIWYFP